MSGAVSGVVGASVSSDARSRAFPRLANLTDGSRSLREAVGNSGLACL